MIFWAFERGGFGTMSAVYRSKYKSSLTYLHPSDGSQPVASPSE